MNMRRYSGSSLGWEKGSCILELLAATFATTVKSDEGYPTHMSAESEAEYSENYRKMEVCPEDTVDIWVVYYVSQ